MVIGGIATGRSAAAVRCPVSRGGAAGLPVGSEPAGQGRHGLINDSKTVICHSRRASVQPDPGGHISRGNLVRGMPKQSV